MDLRQRTIAVVIVLVGLSAPGCSVDPGVGLAAEKLTDDGSNAGDASGDGDEPGDGDANSVSCVLDEDCAPRGWCRKPEGGGTCVRYLEVGDVCSGRSSVSEEIPEEQRCAPDDVCVDRPPLIVVAPGRCRERCSEQDCDDGSYCDNEPQVCRANGACFEVADCENAGNNYIRPDCMGYAKCNTGMCAWVCGDPACRDYAKLNLGKCQMLLGWGMQGDTCQAISGCGDQGYKFFTTEIACQKACQVN